MDKSLIVEMAEKNISAMADRIDEISDLYLSMPAIIKKEHDYILEANLDGVEQTVEEKLKVSSQLDDSFLKLREATLELVRNYEEVMETSVDQVANLSQCFLMIDEMVIKLKDQRQSLIGLNQSIEILKSSFEKFSQHKDEYRSQIDVNRVVLSKMLANRQDHYRFWQEVSSDMMAAYDRKGLQRSSTKHSSLSIKA